MEKATQSTIFSIHYNKFRFVEMHPIRRKCTPGNNEKVPAVTAAAGTFFGTTRDETSKGIVFGCRNHRKACKTTLGHDQHELL